VSSTSLALGAKLKPIDPFLKFHELSLIEAGPNRITFDEVTWDFSKRDAVGVDIEVYRNLLVICFKRFSDGFRYTFESSERSALDRVTLTKILQSNLLISFHGNGYDLPLIYMALAGATVAELKAASDRIIKTEIPPWSLEETLSVRVPRLNHIDLNEPNPAVRQGLKMLNGRLHGRFMVDLPYHPDAVLTPEQMNVVTLYCHNDLDATELVYRAMLEPLKLRHALGQRYGMDFRSKSDAQMGEAIVKKEVSRGSRLTKPNGFHEHYFNYNVPDFISFTRPDLQKLLRDLATTVFSVTAGGKIQTPPILENLTIIIGKTSYSLGIGGLHSTESHRALYSDEYRSLIDVDVASQYPNIIMKLGLYPAALGPSFLTIYGKLIKERLAAKAAMQDIDDLIKFISSPEDIAKLKKKREVFQVGADGGRVSVNGVYGKLGSPYSVLYAPHMLIATTLTGQLSILMLIEMTEEAGIPVVSANTDGVIFYAPTELEETLQVLLDKWQSATGLVIEQNRYREIYNSSVNTYIAIKEDGKAKRKGYIADPWSEGDLRGQMSKNPQMTICSRAVLQYVLTGKSIEETVRECTDPRTFVTVIKVASGGVWRGFPLGRAVRYYWGIDGEPIYYSDGKKKVSKTDGAVPLMEMLDILPDGIDYVRYCEEGVKLAADLGIKI